MATAQLTRTGHAAAPAGSWAIDPARAVVAFSGRASFLAPTISARFGDVAGASGRCVWNHRRPGRGPRRPC